MYGLPKTHKDDIPYIFILSMIRSSQHEFAKWLAEILEPVLKLYSSHSVKDSFTFANFSQNLISNLQKYFYVLLTSAVCSQTSY